MEHEEKRKKMMWEETNKMQTFQRNSPQIVDDWFYGFIIHIVKSPVIF